MQLAMKREYALADSIDDVCNFSNLQRFVNGILRSFFEHICNWNVRRLGFWDIITQNSFMIMKL
jgi:hypothetical protein